MTIHNLKRLAGIHEGRNAEGDAVLLADSLLRSLKRCRQLSEHYMSKSLINDTKKLKRTLAEQQFGPELFQGREQGGDAGQPGRVELALGGGEDKVFLNRQATENAHVFRHESDAKACDIGGVQSGDVLTAKPHRSR